MSIQNVTSSAAIHLSRITSWDDMSSAKLRSSEANFMRISQTLVVHEYICHVCAAAELECGWQHCCVGAGVLTHT